MKLCTLKSLRFLYDKYNRKYFRNKLPVVEEVEFYWASTCPFMTKGESRKFNKHYYGETLLWEFEDGGEEMYSIVFCDKLKEHSAFLAQTLLHEMVHIQFSSTGHASAGHGYRFKARKRQLMRMGAYDEWT